MVWSKTYTSLL